MATAAMPEAATACPRTLLVDPRTQLWGAAPSSVNAAVRAESSALSLTGDPVPCASRRRTLCTSVSLSRYSLTIMSRMDRVTGAMMDGARPLWLIALARTIA